MLFFQAPFFIFIAICVIHFVFADTNSTIQCIKGFKTNTTASSSRCNDINYAQWICPMSQCGRDGHLWVPMSGCILDVAADAGGVSFQQCASYNIQNDKQYECRNSGDNSYLCPYTTANVPYISCSGCEIPKDSHAEPQLVLP